MDTNGSPSSPAPNSPSPISQHEESVEETRLNSMIRDLGQEESDPPTDLFATERDHLSQASLGLTEALHRLQQLRTSIAGLADRYPNANMRAVEEGDRVGPSHAAIVLSDSSSENYQDGGADDIRPVRVRSTIHATAMERLEEFEASRAARPSTMRRLLREAQAASPLPRREHRSPPLPDLLVPPRRSLMETSLTRERDRSPDDGTTALGRRVAARAAIGATNADARRAGTSEIDRVSLNRAAEFLNGLERAGLHMRNGSQYQLLQSARAGREDDPPFGRSTDESPYPDPIGTMPDRTRVSSGSTSWTDRVQHIQQARDEILARNALSSGANDVQNRNYLVRRRLNADGEEHVHTIDLQNWEADDSTDWIMPSVPPIARPDLSTPAEHRARLTRLQRDLYRTVNEPSASAEGRSRGLPPPTPVPAPRRSRGWARLDADGVEINSDEEGSNERARARESLRIRRAPPELSEGERRATARETLVPMTRTSISHALPEASVQARVRINPPPPWAEWAPSPWINSLYDDPPPNRPGSHFAPSRPRDGPIRLSSPLNEPYAFVPDPLPMPLAAMVPEVVLSRKSQNIIRVHARAGMAGR
ncbi:hypothetical protein HWV62_35994 [Athelia sp. TMB]|nr:hypothetical protein HWV62_35994 [Athelia sp. TMB]